MMSEEAERVGRSLWSEEMTSLASAVSKAVEVREDQEPLHIKYRARQLV